MLNRRGRVQTAILRYCPNNKRGSVPPPVRRKCHPSSALRPPLVRHWATKAHEPFHVLFNGSRLTSQGGIAYTCFSLVRPHFRKPRPLFITFYGLSPFWCFGFQQCDHRLVKQRCGTHCVGFAARDNRFVISSENSNVRHHGIHFLVGEHLC